VSKDISTNPPTARAGAASCSINLGSVLGAGCSARAPWRRVRYCSLRRFSHPMV